MNWVSIKNVLFRSIVFLLSVYIIFNIFWGLNYNRIGLAARLHLDAKKMDTADLIHLQSLLLARVNESKKVLVRSKEAFPSNKELFTRAHACYIQASKELPLLHYKYLSVKSSLFGWLGNYLGFTGYYNPFTGEAQVNTNVPAFIQPYTTVHEIGHQIGLAKEEEANFAGYLAASYSTDTLFRYSTYLDLFVYANREVFIIDSLSAKSAVQHLAPEVKEDIREWRDFIKRHKNPFEPVVTWIYGNYLRANQQPKGMLSYNNVIHDLVAYYKKFGKI